MGDIKEQLKFPISINVKVVLDKTLTKQEAKITIMNICSEFKTAPVWQGAKESKNGNFISYTVFVNLESHEVFHSLYMELGKVPGVKLVL